MKKHIPHLLTCSNLATGAIGIYVVMTINWEYAFYFVLVATGFDFLDGLAARLLGVPSKFGTQLDSLADLTSFGLLPSFFMMEWMEDASSLFFLAVLIAIFSALRLAKFNIDDSQRETFKGLPTPANAFMITSLVFLDLAPGKWTMILIIILSCTLMVSGIPMMSLKFNRHEATRNKRKMAFILGGIILFIVFRKTFLPFLIPYYIGFSVLSLQIKKS